MTEINRTVLGAFEYVSFPSLGIEPVVAKIDTGAYSGAIHCSMIEAYKRSLDGKKLLRFTPSDNYAYTTETEHYTEAYVRSSTGHKVKRYLINTEVMIKNKKYPITIGLSNRTEMHTEVLIGRRFLREHDVLVNTRMNQELDNDGGDTYENSNPL